MSIIRLRRAEALSVLGAILGGAAVAFSCFLLFLPPVFSQQDPNAEAHRAQDEAKLITVKIAGVMDAAGVENRVRLLRNRLEEYPDTGFIVFDIDSSGGDPDAAHTLAQYIFTDLKPYTTVAWIRPNKRAQGAAALIAVAANKIAMGRDSRLGADLSRTYSEEEIEKLRDWLRTYGRARGYPTALTDAMVSKKDEDVFLVRFAARRGTEEKVEFLTQRDLDSLNFERKGRLQGEKVVAVEKGTLLLMSDVQARRYGVAAYTADDEATLKIEIHSFAGPEDTIDLVDGVKKPMSLGAQQTLKFLNHPITRFVLLLVGCLGILIELKMFGTMVAGGIGLGSFAIFFSAGILGGATSPWEALLFVLGIVLIAVEFLLVPGVAIFAVSGAAVAAIALVLAMVPPAAALGSQTMTGAVQDAIATLAFGFGTGAVSFLVLLRYLPQSPFFARRGLVMDAAIVGVPTADSALAAQASQRELLGQTGTAETTLRPAGRVELDSGRLLDVVAGGEFIEAGTRVKVINCEAGINVVARLEGPPGP